MRIVFTPAAAGRATASFAYDNPRNAELVINVTGVGTTAPVRIDVPASVRVELGSTFRLPIELRVPPPAEANVNALVILLGHHPTAVRSSLAVQDVSPAWTVTAASVADTIVRVEATYQGVPPVPAGMLATVEFGAYLSAATTSTITARLTELPSCLVPQDGQTQVTIDGVCYNEGRLIDLGRGRFQLDPPAPNPASDVAYIRYGIGIMCTASFRLTDATGRLIRAWHIDHASAGSYVTDVDCSEFASGAYRLTMQAGPYRSSTVIIKP
jgi:hypothetical protein